MKSRKTIKNSEKNKNRKKINNNRLKSKKIKVKIGKSKYNFLLKKFDESINWKCIYRSLDSKECVLFYTIL